MNFQIQSPRRSGRSEFFKSSRSRVPREQTLGEREGRPGRQEVVTVRVEQPFMPAHYGRVLLPAEAQLPAEEGVAVPTVEAHLARDGLGVEPEGTRVRACAADVHYAADLPGSPIREEIDVTDRRHEAEQATVRVDDLHVLGVAAGYPGSWTGAAEARKSRVQS